MTNFYTHKLEIQGPAKPYLDKKIEIHDKIEAGWCTQFWAIFKRTGVNTFRQPMDFIMKVIQAIFFGVICIVLYY